MKAVAVVAGILLVLVGGFVLAARFSVIPTDLLASVPGTSSFLPSDAALYAGTGGVLAGFILMVVGAKARRMPKPRTFVSPVPSLQPASTGGMAASTTADSASTPSVTVATDPPPSATTRAPLKTDVTPHEEPTASPAPARSGNFGDPATWEHFTGVYQFQSGKVTSSELFGVRLAKRTLLNRDKAFIVRARITVTKDAPDPSSNKVYVGVAVFDEVGSYLGHFYTVLGDVQTVSQGAVTYEHTFEAASLLALLSTANAIAPAILVNYTADGRSSGAVSECDLCELLPA